MKPLRYAVLAGLLAALTVPALAQDTSGLQGMLAYNKKQFKHQPKTTLRGAGKVRIRIPKPQKGYRPKF